MLQAHGKYEKLKSRKTYESNLQKLNFNPYP